MLAPRNGQHAVDAKGSVTPPGLITLARGRCADEPDDREGLATRRTEASARTSAGCDHLHSSDHCMHKELDGIKGRAALW